MRLVNLLFFSSQGFIMFIPNPKHQWLPWDSFFVDPGKDDPGSTFCVKERLFLGAVFLALTLYAPLQLRIAIVCKYFQTHYDPSLLKYQYYHFPFLQHKELGKANKKQQSAILKIINTDLPLYILSAFQHDFELLTQYLYFILRLQFL